MKKGFKQKKKIKEKKLKIQGAPLKKKKKKKKIILYEKKKQLF